MITQAIKRWLSNLFAWLPWKRTAMNAYAPPSRNGVMTIPQEHLWRSSDDGSLPQTGVTSVAVEQGSSDPMPETTLPLHPSLPEHVDMVTQSPQVKDTSSPPSDEKILENMTPPELQFASEITPTPEQQLAFLQYMVDHGLINEGFEEGKVPEQYRKRK